MATRTERLVRLFEVAEGDEVRVNAGSKTKPTLLREKTHLGDNRWRVTLGTGEVRTYTDDDQIILVTRGDA